MGRRAKGDGSIIKHKDGYKGYITTNGKRIYRYGKNKIEVSEKLKTLEADLRNGVNINDKSTLGQWINTYIIDFEYNSSKRAPKSESECSYHGKLVQP